MLPLKRLCYWLWYRPSPLYRNNLMMIPSTHMRRCCLLLMSTMAVLATTGCDDTTLPAPENTNAETTSFPGTSPPRSVATPTRPPSPQQSSIDEDDRNTPQQPGKAEFAGLEGPIPVTWTWEPPRHHFRVAQWIVPGREGAEPAEMVVTTFPEASGNTVQNNIDR